MVFAEHFNAYKEVIAKHQKINESHKKFYIIWVELFLKYLGQDSSVEDKLPKAEMLTNFTKYLYDSNKYQEWQINQAIDAVSLLFALSKDNNSEFSLEIVIGQIQNTIKLKHYSDKTGNNYIYWTKQFYYFIQKSFAACNSMDVKKFLTYLAKDQPARTPVVSAIIPCSQGAGQLHITLALILTFRNRKHNSGV